PVTPAVAVTVPTSLANLNSNLRAVIEGSSHLFGRSLRRSDKTQRGDQQRQCKQSFHNILLGYLRFTQRGSNREAAVSVGRAGCELLRNCIVPAIIDEGYANSSQGRYFSLRSFILLDDKLVCWICDASLITCNSSCFSGHAPESN